MKNHLFYSALACLIGLGGGAIADGHEKGERQTLMLSGHGVSDAKSPETFTFVAQVESRCYSGIDEALSAHGKLSNALQAALKTLDVGKVKTSGVSISEYSESTRSGTLVCENTKRIVQSILLVSNKLDRATIVAVYKAVSTSEASEGVRAGKAGEKAVVASLNAPVGGLTPETYKVLRAQAIVRATADLEEQKAAVEKACSLEGLSRAPSMSWSIGQPLSPRPRNFGRAEAAFDGGSVAEIDPEGITVTADVTATYTHDGGFCRAR